MKFEISRTRSSAHSGAPCPGAEDASHARIDARGRPYVRICWTIELLTLEDLLALMKLVNDPIIVHPADHEYGTGNPELEIYDGYRE